MADSIFSVECAESDEKIEQAFTACGGKYTFVLSGGKWKGVVHY